MQGNQQIYDKLNELNIEFEYIEHPSIPTIELAKIHKKDIDATHCKNVFLRNHKGKKHYFVVLEQSKNVNIRQLELMLKQGKLSFASNKRLTKYLNTKQGAVSPLGLIFDQENNTTLFIDKELEGEKKLSFHPNVDNASLVISYADLIKFIEDKGIRYELLDLSI